MIYTYHISLLSGDKKEEGLKRGHNETTQEITQERVQKSTQRRAQKEGTYFSKSTQELNLESES